MENYSKRARTNTFVRAMVPAGRRSSLGFRYNRSWRRFPLYRRPVVFSTRVPSYGRFGTGRGPRAQIEKKFYDTALAFGASGGVASTTQATGAINLTLGQGTSANTRIGQKIIVKSIQMKIHATLAAGATDNDNFHVFVIQDTQCNGALPAIGDFFDAGGGIIGTQLRNMANGARFRLLKHFVFVLNADAGVAAAFGGDNQQQECYIKCNIPITYNSTLGAITEIRTNNLFCIYGSTQGVATAQGPCRIRYTDQ